MGGTAGKQLPCVSRCRVWSLRWILMSPQRLPTNFRCVPLACNGLLRRTQHHVSSSNFPDSLYRRNSSRALSRPRLSSLFSFSFSICSNLTAGCSDFLRFLQNTVQQLCSELCTWPRNWLQSCAQS